MTANPYPDLLTALEAARMTLPANVVLGWEIPHDAAADDEIKGRRYERHVQWATRHDMQRPPALATGPHVLLELVLLPGGRCAYQWATPDELSNVPVAVADLLRRLLATTESVTVIAP